MFSRAVKKLVSMDLQCSFKALTGGGCGHGPRDRHKYSNVIPFLACKKEISSHENLFQFAGHENEIDLILSRAGLFTRPKDIETWTICPLHRGKLGLGWTRKSTRCRVPVQISNHGKGKRTWPKGERGIGKRDTQLILKRTGVFIQAGSGI